MTEHEQQRALDDAARELAQRLRPWAGGMQDPDAFAADFMEWQRERGLRYVPRPSQITGGHRDPAAYERGAAKARAALEARNRTDEGDPHA